MNSLIIYESFHHGNTRKVAEAINEELKGTLISVLDVQTVDLRQFDPIGFGSGVYYDDLHNTILAMGEREPLEGKHVFVFSTSKKGQTGPHANIKTILEHRGALVLGDFACRGYDTAGIWKLLGGRSKDHPDQEDLAQARAFARNVRKQMETDNGSL